MSVYSNIKSICSNQKISVSKIEKDLGFARSSIYKWDKHQPGAEKLKRVADYLKVSVDKLLEDTKQVEAERKT